MDAPPSAGIAESGATASNVALCTIFCEFMPNAIDLVTIADLKTWLRLESSTKDDNLLQSLITNISQEILTRTGRDAIVSASYEEAYDGSGTPMQALRHYPITAVASLEISDSPIVPSPDGVQTGFTFDDFVLKLVGQPVAFPFGPGVYGAPGYFIKGFQNVVVNYTAGYSAVPFDLSEAAKEWCAYRYKQREWIGQTSKHLATGETVSYSQRAMPEYVREVIERYKRLIPV